MENNNQDADFGFDFLDDMSLDGLEIEVPEENLEIDVEEIDLDAEEDTDLENPEKTEAGEEEEEEKPKKVEKTEVDKTEVKKEVEEEEGVIKVSAFLDILKDNELLDIEDGQEIDEETLITGLKKASEKKAANQIFDIVTKVQGQKGWKLFEDLFINGASQTYLEDHFSQESLENLDLTDPEIQEKLYRDYLKESSQFDEDEIEEQIDFLKSKEKLKIKAEIARTELIKSIDKRKAAEAEKAAEITRKRKESEQDYINSLSETLSSVSKTKEIEGVPLTEDDTKTLVSYVTQKKFELTNGLKVSEFEKDLIELRKDPKSALKLAKMVREKLNTEPIIDKKQSKKASFLFKSIESDIKKEELPKGKAQNIESLLKLLD